MKVAVTQKYFLKLIQENIRPMIAKIIKIGSDIKTGFRKLTKLKKYSESDFPASSELSPDRWKPNGYTAIESPARAIKEKRDLYKTLSLSTSSRLCFS